MRTEVPITGVRRRLYGDEIPATRGHEALAVVAPDRAYPEPVLPPDAQQGGIDLASLLRTLRRRSPIILLMAVLGFCLGLALQSAVTPRYSSSVSLLLEPKRSDAFGADTQFGSFFVDTTKIASVVSVIQSSGMLSRVVATAHLDQIPEFGDPPQSHLKKWLGFLPFVTVQPARNDPAARQERALELLKRAVRVERVGLTYVLTIEARASRPEIAQRVAGAVADVYLNDQVERDAAARQRDSGWLAGRLANARRDLMQSEESLDAVRRKYNLLDIGSGTTVDRQTLAESTTQLSQAQADVANARGRYEQAERIRDSGGNLEELPEVSASHTMEDLRKSQLEVAAKLTDLTRVYQDSFPEVRRVREQQALLQREVAAEVGKIVEGLRVQYETAVAREQALKERLQRAADADGGAAGDEGRERLRDAQRLVDANRGLYDALVTRWRDVQQQETRNEPEARVISAASLPAQPSSPKPLLFPVGGAMGMLFVGLGLTLVPTLLDNRFTSVTAVEQRLGLTVLGAIPMLRRRDLAIARRRRSILEYANRRPLSRFAESLRTLRAYLRISTDGPSSIIQVTSALSGEGKSTVAATLAISAASAGVRTVLIDADVRSSSVSEMFGRRHEEGLTDILELGVPVRSVLHDYDGLPLTILGSGSSLLPRPDIIATNEFAALLRELAEDYGLIILDSPPVLPVSDALVLSKHADATIMVVKWRATPKAVAEQAVKVLRTVRAPLVGVMLNKIDLSKVSQYDRGYSQYG